MHIILFIFSIIIYSKNGYAQPTLIRTDLQSSVNNYDLNILSKFRKYKFITTSITTNNISFGHLVIGIASFPYNTVKWNLYATSTLNLLIFYNLVIPTFRSFLLVEIPQPIPPLISPKNIILPEVFLHHLLQRVVWAAKKQVHKI